MRQKKTEDRWREAVSAQKASGSGPGEYCRKERICLTSFYAWRKRLGMSKWPAAGVKLSKGFMRLMPPAPLVAEPVAAMAAIRIETPNGYQVDAGYEGEDGLKSVLNVLRCL